MSVEFRQRTPGEYAQIVWRRKWLIILPAIAIATAVAWVVWRLPNVYESTTLLIVKPPTIPSGLVPTLSDVDLSQRINNIGQMVTSRSSLEPLILQYDLYHAERQSGEAMESVVEHMRKDITTEIDKSRNDVTNAFRISYRERDPDKTRAVTGKLADKYTSAQIDAATQASGQTKQFFDQQLAEARKQLDEIDHQRLQYMQSHVGSLPSQTGPLVGQLSGLHEQQKSLIAESGRLRDMIAAYNTQLGDIAKQHTKEIENVVLDITDPKTTQGYSELLKRKSELEAEKQNLLTTLREKNPDVIAKQNQIDFVQKAMDQQITEYKEKVRERTERLRNSEDPRIPSIKVSQQLARGDLDRVQTMLDQTNSQIVDVEQRINQLPQSEVDLDGINREYQTKKASYDDLLKKQEAAALAANVLTNAQGESIQVIDPANRPQSPVAPKRPVLMMMGLALGLAVGVAFAAAIEVPRLFTIQTKADAAHYTGLPVLISVPDLLTPQEARRIPIRRALLLVAGIAATIVSIPVLALALKMSNIFDRFVS